jgi:hypothetical protein
MKKDIQDIRLKLLEDKIDGNNWSLFLFDHGDIFLDIHYNKYLVLLQPYQRFFISYIRYFIFDNIEIATSYLSIFKFKPMKKNFLGKYKNIYLELFYNIDMER